MNNLSNLRLCVEKSLSVKIKKELKETLLEIFRDSAPVAPQDLKPEEKMDRRKAAKFLGVSYQTMYNWTKSGVLKENGHGRKKYYLRPELIEAMKNIG